MAGKKPSTLLLKDSGSMPNDLGKDSLQIGIPHEQDDVGEGLIANFENSMNLAQITESVKSLTTPAHFAKLQRTTTQDFPTTELKDRDGA